MSQVNIYDCPNWTNYTPIKGSLIDTVNADSFMLIADCFFINGSLHAVFKRTYNMDENKNEIWLKGSIDKTK